MPNRDSNKALEEIHSEHLKATDRKLAENLQRELKSGNQRIRDDAVAKLFSHLEVNPKSIRRMLPPLIYIVESSNWADDSSTKLDAIELLKGIQQNQSTAQVLETYYKRRAAQHRKGFATFRCHNKSCQQRLRILVPKSRLTITCPKCNTLFEYLLHG